MNYDKPRSKYYTVTSKLLNLLYTLLGGNKGPVWDQEQDEVMLNPFLDRMGVEKVRAEDEDAKDI